MTRPGERSRRVDRLTPEKRQLIALRAMRRIGARVQFQRGWQALVAINFRCSPSWVTRLIKDHNCVPSERMLRDAGLL